MLNALRWPFGGRQDGDAPEGTDPASLAGRTIAQFEIQAEIGRGGMGVVYEARDTRLDRMVAVKALAGHGAAASQDVRTFSREALAASKLRHPYICQVYDVLELGDLELIVMERLDGEDLRQRLDRGPLRVSEALAIATEAAEALRDTHSHALIHRDIKPSNLFLTQSGHVKLLDFGIARLLPRATGASVSRPPRLSSGASGVLAPGTLGYMAPEQALGEPVDERADLFSLGAVIYEMLAGRPPFPGTGLTDFLHGLLVAPPPLLERARPGLPPALVELVAQLLEREAGNRPVSMAEVYRRLVGIASLMSGSIMTTQRLRVTPGAPRTQYTRRSGVSIAWQATGGGPADMVLLPGWVSHLDQSWQEPRVARVLHRLAQGRRLIRFDKRGFGLSDRGASPATLDQRAEDLRAVLDELASTRTVLVGLSEGAGVAAQFAALHPDRVSALVLYAAFARRAWAPDYPWGPTTEQRERWYQSLQRHWGSAVDIDLVAPSLANDPEFRDWYASYLRHSASPGTALELAQLTGSIDIRAVLPLIHVPTLVIHRTGDRYVLPAEGRYLAERIPGARFVELPGDDHLLYAGDNESVLALIEEFARRHR